LYLLHVAIKECWLLNVESCCCRALDFYSKGTFIRCRRARGSTRGIYKLCSSVAAALGTAQNGLRWVSTASPGADKRPVLTAPPLSQIKPPGGGVVKPKLVSQLEPGQAMKCRVVLSLSPLQENSERDGYDVITASTVQYLLPAV